MPTATPFWSSAAHLPTKTLRCSGRSLFAGLTIEIVSPANKDRPEHRNVFVGKCAALLQKGVAVGIVDLVTVKRRFQKLGEVPVLLGFSRPGPILKQFPTG